MLKNRLSCWGFGWPCESLAAEEEEGARRVEMELEEKEGEREIVSGQERGRERAGRRAGGRAA